MYVGAILMIMRLPPCVCFTCFVLLVQCCSYFLFIMDDIFSVYWYFQQVDLLDMLIDHIDKVNHKRTCSYLTSCARY